MVTAVESKNGLSIGELPSIFLRWYYPDQVRRVFLSHPPPANSTPNGLSKLRKGEN